MQKALSAGPIDVEVQDSPANLFRRLFEYVRGTGRTAGTTRGTVASQPGWRMKSRSLIEEVLSVSFVIYVHKFMYICGASSWSFMIVGI